MPGLLRGIARTAVVAGTATAVSNRVSRRQAGRWADQDQQAADQQQMQNDQQQAAQAPPAPDTSSQIHQLQQLAQLKDQGVLTDAEFTEQKRRILG
jgi:hypothetical protein